MVKWTEEFNRKKALIQQRELRRIREKAKSVPCMDCLKEYTTDKMHFDHRSREEKSFTIATASVSPWKLLREIAKCDVVCSLCHTDRTRVRGYTKVGQYRKTRRVERVEEEAVCEQLLLFEDIDCFSVVEEPE